MQLHRSSMSGLIQLFQIMFKTKIIGLTATPGRSIDNEESNRSLSNFFHSNIISIPEREEGVISYLRKILLDHNSQFFI